MNMVIVICSTHHNSLIVIRALGERGYYIEFVNFNAGKKFDYVSKSKYISKYRSLSGIEQIYTYLQVWRYLNIKKSLFLV